MERSLEQLMRLLEQAPVMGKFHPLLPLALPPEVLVADSASEVAITLDELEVHKERPVLVNDFDASYIHRFLVHHYQERPAIDALNQFLPERLTTKGSILRQSDIAGRVARDFAEYGYQAIVLLLIDGLSYEDVRQWPERIEPCLVDGPSITYGRNRAEKIAPDIGFARILGQPTLARVLRELGLYHARGYSYWKRSQNQVSQYLFGGIPLRAVSSFSQALELLEKEPLSGHYVQIVREGTDGLAHRRREVQRAEVESTVQAIHEDLRRVVDLLLRRQLKGAVYLTSDHGMLWKNAHDFELLPSVEASSARYSLEAPPRSECAVAFSAAGRSFYAYKYPYIARRIRSNDSGVHGGVSYFESVVPFVQIEVNP